MADNPHNNNNQVVGAVTFPSRNEENSQPVPVLPRQPRNLQGLLRFAMEATKVEDAPGNSEFTPMDEERRKFLEEALKSLTVDMAEVIHTAIKILSDEEKISAIQLGDALPDDVQRAFNNLLELIDDIDVANDFYKMGGFAIFPVCLGSENDSVRALASTILGEACQNNPFCQSKALECGLLSVVLTLVQSERGEALAKGLYALSCACREYEPACRELVCSGGCEALALLLQAEEPAARTKAAFLVRYLCHNCSHAKGMCCVFFDLCPNCSQAKCTCSIFFDIRYNSTDAKEKFITLNLIKTIAGHIKKGRDSTTEHLLSIILALLENRDSTVIRQCMDPGLGLKNIIEEHLKHPDLVDDTFREEKEYCAEVLGILESYPKVESVDEEVDR